MAQFLGGGTSSSQRPEEREEKKQKPLGLGGAADVSGRRERPSPIFNTPPAPTSEQRSTPNPFVPQVTPQAPTPQPQDFRLGAATSANAGKLTKAERAAIDAQNWAVEAGKPIENIEDFYKYANIKELQDFDYGLSDAQIQAKLNPGETPAAGAADQSRVVAEDTEAAQMTWEQYDALNEDQKAAVDFNTLLVKARERDLKRASVPWKAERVNTYNERLERIFGPGGNSETMGFSVAKLLDDIEFKAVGQDIDEFLSLDRAIDAKELTGLKLTVDTPEQGEPNQRQGMVVPDPTDPGYRNYDSITSPENMVNVDSTAIRNARDLIEERMSDPSQSYWGDFEATMNGGVDLKGMTPEELKNLSPNVIPYGFGSQFRDVGVPEDQLTMDRWYAQTWSRLNNPNEKDPMKAILSEMDTYKFTEQDRREFFEQMNNRTLSAIQYGAPTTEGARTPQEIRQLLGLGD